MGKTTRTKSIYLYDIAGALIATFFIAPLISFLWNAIVIFLLVLFLGEIRRIGMTKMILGIVFISIAGAILDFVSYIIPTQSYINYVSEKNFHDYFATHTQGPLPPAQYLQNFGLYFMLIPILTIGIFNFILAKNYFNVNKNKAIIIGILMGLLTAPWILYLYSYGPNYH